MKISHVMYLSYLPICLIEGWEKGTCQSAHLILGHLLCISTIHGHNNPRILCFQKSACLSYSSSSSVLLKNLIFSKDTCPEFLIYYHNFFHTAVTLLISLLLVYFIFFPQHLSYLKYYIIYTFVIYIVYLSISTHQNINSIRL